MTQPTLDTLIRRLDRLERRSRCWKALGGVTLVVLGFILVSEDGKTSAELFTLAVGTTVLVAVNQGKWSPLRPMRVHPE